MLDPGIGFGKTPEQSIACIARLAEFKRFGLAAAGRRLAQALHQFGDAVAARTNASAARSPAISQAVKNGAAIVRVHDVAETVQALRVAAAIEAAR